MKRVNLDPNADFVGNRPPKPKGVQLIRRHDQRRPMIDIEEGDVAAAEEQRRKAVLEEKERSRAEHQAAQDLGRGAGAKAKAGKSQAADAQKGGGVVHCVENGYGGGDHTKRRMEKLQWEVEAAELRSNVAHYRAVIADYDAKVADAGFKMVMGMGFWTPLATLLAATETMIGAAAAWGIRGWRGGILLYKMKQSYEGLDLGHGIHIPYRKLPELRSMAKRALEFADSVSDAIDKAAKVYDDDLRTLNATVVDGGTKVDEWHRRREDTYQHCLQSGNLPPGTWRRPAPAYTLDDEGAIIGVN